MDRRERLLLEDDQAWAQLHDRLQELSPEQMTEPGFTEDWTVKDFLAHLGCWMAQAAHVLERIRLGTYERVEVDEDRMNHLFYDLCQDLDLVAVKCGLQSSRIRMLQEWYALPEVTPLADEWFSESGPKHIAEHMPDLERFVRNRR
jgi:hypothetical protein